MLAGFTLTACILYAVPLIVLVALLRDPEDDALDLACALGTAFAVDLLGTFLLARAMTSERAAFARTIGLVAACAVLIALRRRRHGHLFPERGALSRRDLEALLWAAGLGLILSFTVSSQNWIWDREWHTPFTASLRAQRLPFQNIYEPGKAFRYHLVGDFAGAVLQSLSFAAMSAYRALSVAHDLQSLLLVAMTALLLRSAADWPPATAAIAAVLPFLAGPMAFYAGEHRGLGAYEGFSDFNNFTLSFRPHCMVALVVLVAVVARVVQLARLSPSAADRPAKAAALVPLVALLGISDEISTLLVGCALAIVWLVRPGLLASSRWRGGLLLGVCGLAALVANLVLAGTIAPGGPVQAMRWVAPRLPHFFTTPLPLNLSPYPWAELFIDVGSTYIPLAVIVYVMVRDRRAAEPSLQLPAIFCAATALGSLLLFLCFEVNGRTFEGHRFMTAARIVVPTLALLVLPRLPRGSFAGVLLLAPIVGGAFASLGYAYYRLPEGGHRQEAQYTVNCRSQYHARLGEPMVPTFVDSPIWYQYAGCHPVFAAPVNGPGDVVLVGWPDAGTSGFAKMNAGFFPPGKPARVVCAQEPAKRSALCQAAIRTGSCLFTGTDGITCEVPADRRAGLAR